MMAQEAVIEQLLPVEKTEQAEIASCTIYEPGAAETLQRGEENGIAYEMVRYVRK